MVKWSYKNQLGETKMYLLSKRTKLGILAASVFACFGLYQSASAASPNTFTDDNGVVWGYEIKAYQNARRVNPNDYCGENEMTEATAPTISFKSAPAGITTLTVPSFAEVVAKIGDPTLADYDTYYIDNLFEDPTEVTAPNGLVKIDMTNAAKLQVRSFAPLLDSYNGELELSFGDDVVIADNQNVTATGCNSGYRYDFTYEKGAFEGLNLKINGLDKLKYIGWRAFKDANLNAQNREITISSSQTVGGQAFENTNVTSIDFEAAEIGEAFCRGCSKLASLEIGADTKHIYGEAFRNTAALAQAFDTKGLKTIGWHAFDGSGITSLSFGAALEDIRDMAFANTNLGSLDFTGTKTSVGVLAFYNAKLNSIDLAEIESIDTMAFANNNLTELYLPKSIEHVGAAIFAGNPLEEVTVAYDPLTLKAYKNDWSNSSMPFSVLISGGCGYVSYGPAGIMAHEMEHNPERTVKVLNLVAPYGENDIVPARSTVTSENPIGTVIVQNAKNIVAPQYFEDFGAYLEEINIGEGFEYIGYQAFGAPYITVGYGSSGLNRITRQNERGAAPTKLSLPSTLKGIGANAFLWRLNNEDLDFENLPTNIEYVGSQAFMFNTGLEITHLNLPKLRYVGPMAFYGVKIKSLTINDSIERIEHGAFVGNYDLKNLYFDTDIFGKKNGQPILGSRFNDVFIGNLYTNYGMSGPDVANGSFKEGNDGAKYRYHLNTISFSNKSTTAPMGNRDLYRIYTDNFLADETSWTKVPLGTFFGAKIKNLKLPETIETIEAYAFMRAEIENPVSLPEGLKKIDDYAFWGTITSDDLDSSHVPPEYPQLDTAKIRVPLESLPSTVEEIGSYAFFDQLGFTGDLDLPNLKVIGNQAFFGSAIHNAVLPHTIERLGAEVLYMTPYLNDVTIDVDLYDASIAQYAINNKHQTFVWFFGDGEHKLGTVTFTENAGEPVGGFASYNSAYTTATLACSTAANCGKDYAYFYGLEAAKLDLSATDWKTVAPSTFQTVKIDQIILPENLEAIGEDAFYLANVGEVVLPDSLKTIGVEAFQQAKAEISEFPEGLLNIDRSAFYAADITDDITIPASVAHIGKDAFNAGPEDIEYNSVTLKPNLTFANTDNQLIHQLFWGSKVKELNIESTTLPALAANVGAGQQEFWNMSMDKVTITDLPGISYGAFENCSNLTEVDMSEDAAMRAIGTEAFLNAEKLRKIDWAPELKEEIVTIGQRAFKGTAFETMGDASKEFDLTAALFDGSEGYAFSGMPKLRTVDVPRTFTNATIPRATFYDDGELVEATIDYKITDMKNAAFANDDKLERIFIWGNTYVEDKNIGGYTMPTRAPDDTVGDDFGPTIPEGTDIYAYSVSPTEAYAGYDGREDFEGVFYPLDEVIYLTSNRPRVQFTDDGDDFDKSDLIVYGMRRDGMILESDNWGEYDGVVYPRSSANLTFEKQPIVMAQRPAFGTIWDTPVPIDELDFGNENFAEIEFEFIKDDDSGDVHLVNIIYTDKYTRGLPDTDIDPYAPREKDGGSEGTPGTPSTFDRGILGYIAAVVVLAGIAVVAIRKARK